MEKQLLPSLLSCDFYRIEDELKAIESCGVKSIHLDIMDGNFVPNISYGPGVIKKIRPHTKLFFDAHLMVKEPDFIFESLKDAGCNLITVHFEACKHIHRTLQNIKSLGLKAGLALNPGTGPEQIEYLLDMVDLVLVMSVNPGFGGQSFIESSMKKVKKLRQMIDGTGREIILEIDGGVKADNLKMIRDAGCDWLVAGSAVFEHGKTHENAKRLLSILGE